MTLLEYASQFIGTPYVWGGNDTSAGGMDCSGFVLECLRAFNKWGRDDASAQDIYNKFNGKPTTGTGVLVFFGKSTKDITHVCFRFNQDQFLEAGGGSATIHAGMVRLRPHTWRSDKVAEVPF